MSPYTLATALALAMYGASAAVFAYFDIAGSPLKRALFAAAIALLWDDLFLVARAYPGARHWADPWRWHALYVQAGFLTALTLTLIMLPGAALAPGLAVAAALGLFAALVIDHAPKSPSAPVDPTHHDLAALAQPGNRTRAVLHVWPLAATALVLALALLPPDAGWQTGTVLMLVIVTLSLAGPRPVPGLTWQDVLRLPRTLGYLTLMIATFAF
ncbi:MAG: hypothetical protein AAFQ79_17510 [Pseudomonadota bacterium]